MAVPDYQSLMYPVLAELQDGQERLLRDVRDRVAARLHLTDTELAELIPSGRQTLFANRANWAHVYLKQAGLLQTIRRGVYQITERGRQALQENPHVINNDYLRKFPEFLEFMERTYGTGTTKGSLSEQATASTLSAERASQTPDEQVREGYRRARSGVAAELLDRMRRASPAFLSSWLWIC